MAITVASDLADSQIEIYEKAVIVSGANLSSIDRDGSVTLGGSINGASDNFTIYTKLTPVTAALTDGTDVTPITMSDSKVTITPAEYGNVVTTTKLGDAKTAGKASLAAAKLIGLNMIESPNAKGVATLEGATNATAAATLNTLAKGDLRDAFTKLADAGVLPLAGGKYYARMNPNQVADIKDDYIDVVKYTNAGEALSGEVGELEGFKIIMDRAVTAGTVICYGDNALGKSESASTNATIIDGSDRLGRERNYGWVGIYEYGLVDQNAVQLITGA